MKRLAQSAVAVAFGALIVIASVVGGVLVTNPNVQTVDDAATHAGFGTTEAASFWSVVDKMAATAGGLSVTGLFDDSSVNKTALDGLDAQETKKELHTLGATQGQNNENILTAYGNYLEDTRTIARLQGKNAYIRALNNGSSESAARAAAIEAVADYYSVKQKNLISSWNTSVGVLNNSRTVAKNTTGVSSTFSAVLYNTQLVNTDDQPYSFGSSSLTLANASSAKVASVTLDQNQNSGYTDMTTLTPTTGSLHKGTMQFYTEPPNSNFARQKWLDTGEFSSKWSTIETQNTQVQNELDTFIDATYADYVSGQINDTDLVDPYLGARDYSPETGFQTWALSSALSLGLDGPENMSNVGKMVVTDHTANLDYEGIVLTDENPDGGLTVGSTYNASTLNGTQMVVTDSTTRELTGSFTLQSATASDGTEYATNESVTYNNITYETTNTSEYQDLMAELTKLQAELNAKQQQERNAGGGGLLPDFNFGGISAPAGLLVVAGAAVLLLGRN